MKRFTYLFICLPILFQYCAGQNTPKKEFYSNEFNWRVTIPENFETVDSVEMARLQNKGDAMFEKTYDSKIDNQTKTIFMFRSDKLNYFECNYQPFDPAVDGDYLETCQIRDTMLYETFITQMPDLKIDTTSTIEKINNLTFHNFNVHLEYPNKMVLTILTYSRLFDKKEFAVNITYVDKLKGEQLLNAWRSSEFGK